MKAMKEHSDFPTVQGIYNKILAMGYEVFLAGGCVRDGILGRLPNDFDLATSATPDQVLALFKKTVEVGKAFGVIVVIEDGIEVEVTTFRSDGTYKDGRRPTVVEFTSAEEDAKRRDFTMNAIFYDLSNEQVIDFVGGQEDIKNKLIRAVGNPSRRFQEDHLRMLRAVRFMGQLDFKIEQFTRQAILENVAQVSSVSRERIHQELEKLITSDYSIKAIQEFKKLGFVEVLFPGQKFTFEPWIGVSATGSLQRWFLFFNSLWDHELRRTDKMSPSQIQDLAKQIENQLSNLRFSNIEKQNLIKMLSWRVDSKLFKQKSLGELIEISFEENQNYAFKIYAQMSLIDGIKFKKLQKRWVIYQGKKPEPILGGKDLVEDFQGPELGKALKISYWAQLEGLVSDIAEARRFIKNRL